MNNVGQVAYRSGVGSEGIRAGAVDTSRLRYRGCPFEQQHSTKLAVAECRRTKLVQALQVQVDEISKALDSIKLERDLTMSDLRFAHEGQRKAKETYDANSQALVKKWKGNSSLHGTTSRVNLCDLKPCVYDVDAENLAKQHYK